MGVMVTGGSETHPLSDTGSRRGLKLWVVTQFWDNRVLWGILGKGILLRHRGLLKASKTQMQCILLLVRVLRYTVPISILEMMLSLWIFDY